MKKSRTKKSSKPAGVEGLSVLEGAALPYLSDNQDMSDILQVMEKLLHWAAIVDSSDDAIISKSLDGLITSWNRGAERLYGYSADEIVGKPVAVLMPPEKVDDFPRIMSMLQRGEQVDHYETKRLTKDGRIVDVSITVSPIKDIRGNVIGASKIARDISARTEYERRRDSFMSMVSHELKTPLTTQKIQGEYLEHMLIRSNQTQLLPYVQKMNQQTDKLTKLVGDMLDISRIQAGTVVLDRQEFSLEGMLRQVVADIQATCPHPIQLVEPLYGDHFWGDCQRLEQVVTNLLSNAIKYSPDATPIIVSCQEDKGRLQLSVQDFGIGIPETMQTSIFERYYRAADLDESTYPGMGIGLNICQEIVTLHQGTIKVKSQPGQGSIFLVELPIPKLSKTRKAGRSAVRREEVA